MKKLKNGLLVAIEGIDGSGKSVLSKNLFNRLQDYSTVLTKEPGGTVLGEKVREILLDKNARMCPRAEFLLFAASRAEHFNKFVIPCLNEGSIVISDRMSDSSLVYQGYARGLELEIIKSINAWAMDGILPDLVFYLKLDANTALSRIRQRNVPLTGFELEMDFIEKTVEGFEVVFADRGNVVTLDATQSPEELTEQALESIQHYINLDQ